MSHRQDSNSSTSGTAVLERERPAETIICADEAALLADYATGILTAESPFPTPIPAPADLEASRDQVVAAAAARLANEPLGVLTQGLNPSRFDNWMPGLRRKAYRYFPSTTELIHEVLTDAVNPDRSDVTDQLIYAMAEAASFVNAPVEVVKRLTVAYVNRLISDPGFRLEITAWVVMRDSPSLRDDLDALHNSLVDRTAEGLRVLMESFGLVMRAPLTWQDFGSMLLAIIQGTVMRAEVAGDDYDPTVVVHAVIGLTMGVTCRADNDEQDIEETFRHYTAAAQ